MKNNLFRLLLIGVFMCVWQQSNAQSDEDKLIQDMLLIANNFSTPGAEAAAVQSSAGWFSSAQDLGKWNVDISVHGNAVFIPSSKQKKLIQNRQFQILNVKGGSNLLAPTVFGGNTDGAYQGEYLQQQFEFDAIDGLDKKVIIHPFPQVTVGLPFGTEIAVRYIPQINVNNVGVGTYGVGLKHNFSQYIPHHRPDDFNISAVLAYSNININYIYTPIQIGPNILELDRVQVDANIWMAQALASKLYDNFEVFAALGVTNSKFDYTLGGNGALLPRLNNELTAIGGSDTKFKADLGFNLYFGQFEVSSMLTAGSYFNANLGLHYKIK